MFIAGPNETRKGIENNCAESFRNQGENVKMPSRTFVTLAVFCTILEISHCAIDSGVNVFGTTVGPNFERAEGICRYT